MYKIIHNNKIVDVVDKPHFIKFLSTGRVVSTNKSTANGIIGSDKALYSFEPIEKPGVKVASIEIISKEEFSRLQSLLNSGVIPCNDERVLDNTKLEALCRLSDTCNKKIVSGFDIKLSDGRFYHFKLTTEDQINLLNLENQLRTGADTFIYHATDLPCQIFKSEDVRKILAKYRKYVLYHTTYFNTAKSYINSLTDVEKINLFSYGTDISSTTTNAYIKQILKDGE